MDISKLVMLSYRDTGEHYSYDYPTYVGIFTVEESCNRASIISNSLAPQGEDVNFSWTSIDKSGDFNQNALMHMKLNILTSLRIMRRQLCLI